MWIYLPKTRVFLISTRVLWVNVQNESDPPLNVCTPLSPVRRRLTVFISQKRLERDTQNPKANMNQCQNMLLQLNGDKCDHLSILFHLSKSTVNDLFLKISILLTTLRMENLELERWNYLNISQINRIWQCLKKVRSNWIVGFYGFYVTIIIIQESWLMGGRGHFEIILLPT